MEFIKVCPQCGSSNIEPDFSSSWKVASAVPADRCKDCGFGDMIFPEMKEKELKKFQDTKKT